MKVETRKQNLLWGGLLIIFGVVSLVQIYTVLSVWAWVAILSVAGLGAFGVYLTERAKWGLLIPAYVLWMIAGLLVLIELRILRDEAIATFTLAVIALPFLVAFLRQRDQWGLLIPAYVLLAVGIMVGLIGLGVLNDLLVPTYVMFAVAIPFFVVYLRNRQHWWALIPAGIMSIIGLSFLIAEAALQYIGPGVLILAGVWILVRQFMRKEQPEVDKSTAK